ncbi:MAG: hypothetical protein FWG73_04290, partial [Planctomycetaceae bacterium]|nr:hypothetical protein [Planctomycetaceae bacterium]
MKNNKEQKPATHQLVQEEIQTHEATVLSIDRAKRHLMYYFVIIVSSSFWLVIYANVLQSRFLLFFSYALSIFWFVFFTVLLAVLTVRKAFTLMMIEHLSKFHKKKNGTSQL